MYLVSVYFDDKSNKIISDYINKIAQKTGNTFMTDNHVPPHLTIMSVEAREEEKLTEVMEQLERSLTKGQIQLVSVGVLLPYVLYVTPVLNLYLEDMIEQVHDMVKNIPEVRMSRYYQPMQWLPHITLGKKLSKEQMQEAFAVMQGRKLFDKDDRKVGLFLLFLVLIQMFSYYSVYTQGTFLSIRIWQGKALLASFVLPAIFLQAKECMETNRMCGAWMTLFLMMTSACLVSGMGIMLAPIMLGLMTLLYAVKDRNRENIKRAVICCLPNVICAAAYVIIR